MEFLRKQGDFADAPTPDLVLLDLNMPVMDGREVLEQVTVDESLQHLPIVILTTSDDEKDVLSSYRLRASSYVVKPVDFGKLIKVVQTIGEYWFTTVVLPRPD